MVTSGSKPKKSYERVVYTLATLPILLLTVASLTYGGFGIYLFLLLLAILQIVSPTKAGWIIIFVLYFLVAATYAVVMVTDVFQLTKALRPTLLVNLDDSMMFIAIECFMMLVLYLVFRIRPQSQKDRT